MDFDVLDLSEGPRNGLHGRVSSSCTIMSPSRGRTRHLDVQKLWIQEEGEAVILTKVSCSCMFECSTLSWRKHGRR